MDIEQLWHQLQQRVPWDDWPYWAGGGVALWLFRRLFFRRKRRARIRSTPMLELLGADLVSLCRGISICGQTGSGKTSYIKRLMIEVLSHRDVGCLWLCVKHDELENALNVFHLAGRDCFVFRPGETRFNVLRYVLTYWGPTAVADLLEKGDNLINKGSQKEEAFWRAGFREGAIHAATVVHLARGKQAKLSDMHAFLASAPMSPAAAKSKDFCDSVCWQLLEAAEANAKTDADERAVDDAVRFFCEFLPTAGDKVVGSVVLRLVSLLAPFARGAMYETVNADEDDFTPDDSLAGQCVTFDCPACASSENQFIQLIVAQLFTDRAMIRPPTNYCALVTDEYHGVASPAADTMAQSQFRSRKVMCVRAYQGLATLQTVMDEGLKGKHQAHSLISNLATHLYFQNSEKETQEFFSEQCGKRLATLAGGGTSNNEKEMVPQFSTQFSQQLLPRKLGTALINCKSGGAQHGYIVSGYVLGKRFGNVPFKKFEFEQDLR